MNNTLSKVLIFAAGAAIGSVATWKICKDRYEAIIEEEINSVKEKFSVAKSEEIEAEEEDEEDSEQLPKRAYEKPDLKEYAKRLEYYRGQIPEDEMTPEEQPEEEEEYIPDEVEENKAGIYVINPETFGDDEYDTEYYTLYADGVVADGRNYVVDHPENHLGHHYKEHFGTYEADLVCVRNDNQKTDYEITRVDDRYEDLFTVGRVTDEEDTE